MRESDPWSVTIPPGNISGCVDIQVVDDTEAEKNETFTVKLSTSDSSVMLDDATTVVTIMDNES